MLLSNVVCVSAGWPASFLVTAPGPFIGFKGPETLHRKPSLLHAALGLEHHVPRGRLLVGVDGIVCAAAYVALVILPARSSRWYVTRSQIPHEGRQVHLYC